MSARARTWARLPALHWELVVGGLAVAAAAVAFWVTLHSHVYKYPGWLAVQKADFILGPIGVGLYWHHRRPHNRLGLLLIGLGLVGVVYILESSTVPALFGIGLVCELVIFSAMFVVILAFPSGRLEGIVPKLIIAGLLIGSVVFGLVLNLSEPSLAPFLPLSGCRTTCPRNGLALWGPPSWTVQNEYVQIVTSIAASLAAIALFVWRFVTGTPPRRRALAIGAPIAMLFLLAQAIYNTNYLFTPGSGSTSQEPTPGPLHWIYAATPSLFWYGFLFALIAAELYAGRVLRRLVGGSLGRPSFRELEELLRGPLGDPGLRLGFWRPESSDWFNAEGARLAPPGPGQDATEVARDGRAVIEIVHDKQLSDDPELLRAAGAVALLALENAELDAAWRESMRALAESRARLTKASDNERRKLERDLHDGAQQRLLAALLRLSSANELADDIPDLKRRLTATQAELEAAIQELRDLAHGIYPIVLAEVGLAGALRGLAMHSPERVTVNATERRFAPEIEAAFYYCCLEAVQNAFKHAGPQAQTRVRVFTEGHELILEVRDSGAGFDPAAPHDGMGLQGMSDRLGAVGGHVEIRSQPGLGTAVKASAPIDTRSHPDRPRTLS